MTAQPAHPANRSPVLTDDECWEFLATQQVGRLATTIGGEPEIFPLNFAVADRKIYLRTRPGTKLVELVVNSRVAFEADHWDDAVLRSVVVRGSAAILEHDTDLAAAEATGLRSFTGDDTSVWVRIDPTDVSGRRLAR